MYLPPRMDVYLLIGSLFLAGLGIIYIKKSISLSSPNRSFLFLLIILILVLPFMYSFLKPQILSYIIEWESSHCVKTGEAPGGSPQYRCDNGDNIYYSGDGKNGKRLFDGGKGKAHFPYWLVY
jgi:hypothetical protein